MVAIGVILTVGGEPTASVVRPTGMTADCVYVIGNESNSLVKIGHSEDVSRRFAALQSQSPVKLFLLGIFEGGRDAEQRLHTALTSCRKHGEWFELLSSGWETDAVLRVTYELKAGPIWLPEDLHDDPIWCF